MIVKKYLHIFLLFTLLLPQLAHSYPLDGFDETQIKRLEGYYFSLPTPSGRQMLSAGALLSISEITVGKIRLNSFPPHRDPLLQEGLNSIARRYGSGVSLSLLDLTDERNPAYAAINDSASFVPGSVGKLMVAVCFFDALSRVRSSTKDREKLLREHMITADDFIETDEHVVPFYSEKDRMVFYRPIAHGDSANLWTYLDWMMSPSSNAAGSMIMREVLLMNYLGERYGTIPSGSGILESLSPSQRAELMRRSFVNPMQRIGISSGQLLQSSFFTKRGKAFSGSLGSTATTKALVQLLLMIEEGKVIDHFSSLELKRLLYLTQKRERYVGTDALKNMAVYFKAGSFYRCRPEARYACGKYEGNLTNLLNGVIMVESPLVKPNVRYIVALSTNVLRQNSEVLHQSIAEEVQRLVAARTARNR